MVWYTMILLFLPYSEEDNAHSLTEEEDADNPDQIRDQDRFLPIANVAKIMKDRFGLFLI